MLWPLKPSYLVPHGNTTSTLRQFPALESTNSPNPNHLSARQFRANPTGLNSTPASKNIIVSKIMEQGHPQMPRRQKWSVAKPVRLQSLPGYPPYHDDRQMVGSRANTVQ